MTLSQFSARSVYAPSNWRPTPDGTGKLIICDPVTRVTSAVTVDAFNALVKK